MHKHLSAINHLPKNIVAAKIHFFRFGVLFEMESNIMHDETQETTIYCPQHPTYGKDGEESGFEEKEFYVFAEIGKVLYVKDAEITFVGTTLPPALHTLRMKIMEHFYELELHGKIFHPPNDDTMCLVKFGDKTVEIDDYYGDHPIGEDCHFVSKGAKVRWFCRHYEELKDLFV